MTTTCIRQFVECIQFSIQSKRVLWLSNKSTQVECDLTRLERYTLKDKEYFPAHPDEKLFLHSLAWKLKCYVLGLLFHSNQIWTATITRHGVTRKKRRERTSCFKRTQRKKVCINFGLKAILHHRSKEIILQAMNSRVYLCQERNY